MNFTKSQQWRLLDVEIIGVSFPCFFSLPAWKVLQLKCMRNTKRKKKLTYFKKKMMLHFVNFLGVLQTVWRGEVPCLAFFCDCQWSLEVQQAWAKDKLVGPHYLEISSILSKCCIDYLLCTKQWEGEMGNSRKHEQVKILCWLVFCQFDMK